jgi:hypothetical protein
VEEGAVLVKEGVVATGCGDCAMGKECARVAVTGGSRR